MQRWRSLWRDQYHAVDPLRPCRFTGSSVHCRRGLPSPKCLRRGHNSPYSTVRGDISADDSLRQAFDRYRSVTPDLSGPKTVGLFAYPQLSDPAALVSVAHSTGLRARLLVERICAEHRDPQGDPRDLFLRIVRQFDLLSDMLCRVIDLAEAVRSVHPDERWTNAASAAHEALCRYMNTLNTHVGLYQCLDSALKRLPDASTDPALFAAHAVALQFLRDFRKHGIHLDGPSRARLVDLSDQIMLLGRTFLEGANSGGVQVEISVDEARGLGNAFTSRLEYGPSRTACLEASTWESLVLARQHPDPEVRKRFWKAQNASPASQVENLDRLLEARSAFATMTEKASWADVVLEDKMARSSENVGSFLDALSAHTRPLAMRDIQRLGAAKQDHVHLAKEPLMPWDSDFYIDRVASAAPSRSPGAANLSAYFSVGTCLEGLSRLFERIYGIRFEISGSEPGEVWHPTVQKLRVIDESGHMLGTVYCDLFSRVGKVPGAAHYTILCSRRTDWDDPDADSASAEDPTSSEVVLDGIRMPREQTRALEPPASQRLARHGRTEQLPIVVFTCDFDMPDASTGQPGLLSLHEVETLFHEMGHAMHSMIGRTDYHNVAGTRCPTDFVELPSILMEHFLAAPAVLQLFARHYADDRPLPLDLWERHRSSRSQFAALENNLQVVMAVLDHRLHGVSAPSGGVDSSAIWHTVQEEFGVYPPVPGTAWHARFGHLHGYGAAYYSYLFDRAIAARVWDKTFARDPLDRGAGERYKNEVLRWGGGRDSWQCIGALLQDDVVTEGQTEALAMLGKWGVTGSQPKRAS